MQRVHRADDVCRVAAVGRCADGHFVVACITHGVARFSNRGLLDGITDARERQRDSRGAGKRLVAVAPVL